MGCRNCFLKKTAIRPFNDNYETFRGQTNGLSFELALERVLRSTATHVMPEFVRGVLVKQYVMEFTRPVPKMLKGMGDKLWHRELASNRERFAAKFACRVDSVGYNDNASVGDSSPTLEEQLVASTNPDYFELETWLQDREESDGTAPKRKKWRHDNARQAKRQSTRQQATSATQRQPSRLHLNDNSSSAQPRREIARKEREDIAGVSSAQDGRRRAVRAPFVRETATKEREDVRSAHERRKSSSVPDTAVPVRLKSPRSFVRKIKGAGVCTVCGLRSAVCQDSDLTVSISTASHRPLCTQTQVEGSCHPQF